MFVSKEYFTKEKLDIDVSFKLLKKLANQIIQFLIVSFCNSRVIGNLDPFNDCSYLNNKQIKKELAISKLNKVIMIRNIK